MSKKIDTRQMFVKTEEHHQNLLSPIKSSQMNSPSTPLTPDELIELRVRLTRESQKIDDALKSNLPKVVIKNKMKKSSSSELLQPVKSSLKKSDSLKNINRIQFSPEVIVGTTHHVEDYDRQTSPSITAFHLSQDTKVDIRNELNEFKKSMVVHESSKKNTVFYPV
eukprot:NODE_24_length_41419_cov_0.818780.p26 type:complete len:166 gc:universal NODE_24_length_41419_cov_0.818780:9968-9471(-)